MLIIFLWYGLHLKISEATTRGDLQKSCVGKTPVSKSLFNKYKKRSKPKEKKKKTRRFDSNIKQKQPTRDVLEKSCSENMQQIYRRTSELLCNIIEITLQYGCSLVNLLHIFKTLFPRNTSGWLLLVKATFKMKIRNCFSLL